MSEYQTLESGQGDPIVMLHGVLGDNRNWAGCFPYLPNDCHAVALRFPFFDEKNPGVDSVQAATDYAEAFMNQAGYDRVVLCGNSLGGHVALNLALKTPERIRGLVLAGSSGLFERGFSAIPGVHPPREWVKMKTCEVFYDPRHVDDELVDSVMRVVVNRRFARELIKIAMSAKRDHLGDAIKEIACPTLLVWGKQDSVTPPEVAEEFHELIRDSELAWLDLCGHTPMMEHPAEFGRIFSDWWGRRMSHEHLEFSV